MNIYSQEKSGYYLVRVNIYNTIIDCKFAMTPTQCLWNRELFLPHAMPLKGLPLSKQGAYPVIDGKNVSTLHTEWL